MGAVSNTAEVFLSLFNLFTTLAILVGGVVFGIMIYLILRYRERDVGAPEPEDAPTLGRIPPERGRLRTVIISLALSSVILGFLVIGTIDAIDTIQNPPKEGTLEVKVVAFQWAWKFIYPNGYEDANLRVPKGEVVILKVTSEDVFHNFGIIEYKIKIDAIPGQVNTLWFIAKETGEFTIQCFELCGLGHAFMKSKLIVMEPEEFQAWYSSLKVKG